MYVDQAARLRAMAEAMRRQTAESQPQPARRTKVIAVTSGKGGVGKSNLCVNLALSLHSHNKDVIIWDTDIGFANAEILLGVVPTYHLGHLLAGECDIFQIVHDTPMGIKLIAGGSSLGELAEFGMQEAETLVAALNHLEGRADYIVLDTGAGFNKLVEGFTLAADQIVVITTPEPTALTDAYGLIKALHQRSGQRNLDVKLVINQVDDMPTAQRAAERLAVTARNFLNLDLQVLGYIPKDERVPRSVHERRPVVLAYPQTRAAKAFRQIASRIADTHATPVPTLVSPTRNSFFDRIRAFFLK